MIFKIIHNTAGGHVHCSLFAAKAANQTFAKCGGFVLRTDEWPAFQNQAQNFVFEERQPFDADAHRRGFSASPSTPGRPR